MNEYRDRDRDGNNNNNITTLDGSGRPIDSEDQLILRLPLDLADRVRRMIRMKQLDPIEFLFKNDRQLQFKLGNEIYDSSLVDLPCIIESQKTIDKANFYKTADIGQMILVHENTTNNNNNQDNNNNNNNNISESSQQNLISTQFKLGSGITPPTKDIVKNRFREYPLEKKTELAKMEEELVRIIQPGKSENEDIEFITLAELKEKYGSELFNQNSKEPVIFYEKADDQHVTFMDSDDEDDDNTNNYYNSSNNYNNNNTPSGILGSSGTTIKFNRSIVNNLNNTEFPTIIKEEKHDLLTKKPLSTERSPLSGEKRERKTRSDKGKERSSRNSSTTSTLQSPQSIGIHSQTQSIPSGSLKIRLSSPGTISVNSSSGGGTDIPMTNVNISSPLSPSGGSGFGGSEQKESKEDRRRRRKEREREREKRHHHRTTSKDDLMLPIEEQQQPPPPHFQMESSPTSVSSGVNNNNNNVNMMTHASISTPIFNTPNLIPFETQTLSTPTTPQNISAIVDNNNQLSYPNTPNLSISGSNTNPNELLNHRNNLRALQHEYEQLKKRISEVQSSINSVPNKIMKERKQSALDDLQRQANAKQKEIESEESIIEQLQR